LKKPYRKEQPAALPVRGRFGISHPRRPTVLRLQNAIPYKSHFKSSCRFLLSKPPREIFLNTRDGYIFSSIKQVGFSKACSLFRRTPELILQLFQVVLKESTRIRSSRLVYIRPPHFGGIFTVPNLVDFLVHTTHSTMKAWTREESCSQPDL